MSKLTLLALALLVRDIDRGRQHECIYESAYGHEFSLYFPEACPETLDYESSADEEVDGEIIP